MHVVGLTGGIGSGKSALAAELRSLGVPVVDADSVARDCVAPGTPGLRAVIGRFGRSVFADDGTLNRATLAAIVFADASARRDLEAITHPCVRAGIEAELSALADLAEPPALAVVEHPLLVETGAHERVDSVVVVEADLSTRVGRLVAQRGMSEADARARIAAQTDDATRRALADHVITNDGDHVALRDAAARLVTVLVPGPGANE